MSESVQTRATPYVNRLLVTKGLRAFGDGYVSLLLPLYLLEIGLSPLRHAKERVVLGEHADKAPLVTY